MTITGRVEAQFTVPVATASVTTNGGTTVVTFTAGSYFHATYAAALQAALIAQRPVTAGTWSVTYSVSTGKYTIAVTNGTYSITWTSTTAATIVGFPTTAIVAQTTVTGTSQAPGLWIPDAPLMLDCPDTANAPRPTDRRSTSSPTGKVVSHMGTSKYLHTGLRWSHVERARVWRGSETTTGASWQQFLRDVAWNQGHAWFSGSAYVQVYDLGGAKVGINENSGAGLSGWYMRGPGINNMTPKAARGSENVPLYFEIGGIDLESDG